MKTQTAVLSVLIFVLTALQNVAMAGLMQINYGEFQNYPSILTENFSYIDPNNSAESPDETRTGSLIVIGPNGPYAYPSGVTYIPSGPGGKNVYGNDQANDSVMNNKQNLDWQLAKNKPVIPGGSTARILVQEGLPAVKSIELDFTGDTGNAFAAYVAAVGTPNVSRVKFDAYDASNNSLGSTLAFIEPVNSGGLSLDNLVTFKTDDGTNIAKIIYSCYDANMQNPAIADVQVSEGPVLTNVPEPSTIIMVAGAFVAGGCGLLWRRYRLKKLASEPRANKGYYPPS